MQFITYYSYFAVLIVETLWPKAVNQIDTKNCILKCQNAKH